MGTVVHYLSCPVCHGQVLNKVFDAIDNTVSKKAFCIVECAGCSLRFTQDVPDADSISAYYKSEDYISHTNSSKGIINKLYQIVRGITLKQKRQNIQKITGLKTGRLLDVGSGTGMFVKHMRDAGWDVTGAEPDADARQIALSQNQTVLSEMDVLDSLEKESFDAISLWHVLEHVHELDAFIIKLKSLLKTSGTMFIALPNYTSLDAIHYKDHWAAYDVPRHLYHFSPRSIDVLMNKNGLEVIKRQPMWFDSFYISMLSSKYQNGSVNYLGAFLKGLQSNLHAIRSHQKCSSVIYLVKNKD
jgi:2-polyprenyl-3-methyl-5-hydroxy-6-metoxy-1,4-benzoquinol methylase